MQCSPHNCIRQVQEVDGHVPKTVIDAIFPAIPSREDQEAAESHRGFSVPKWPHTRTQRTDTLTPRSSQLQPIH